MQKIGLLGGTFDPIHFGHMNLALGMLETYKLDEIWLIPAYMSPFKTKKKTASTADRLKMVKLAIKDLPQFRVLDIEIKREGPSFTVDTLKDLIKKNKDKKFFLIIGGDCVDDFPLWRDAEEIVDLAKLIVGIRFYNQPGINRNSKVNRAISAGVTHLPVLDISSTEIRKRLKKGLYVRHLIPSKVVDYIYKNRLYSDS